MNTKDPHLTKTPIHNTDNKTVDTSEIENVGDKTVVAETVKVAPNVTDASKNVSDTIASERESSGLQSSINELESDSVVAREPITGTVIPEASDTVALEEAGYKDDKGNGEEFDTTTVDSRNDKETFESEKMQSLHVNEGDLEARSTDFRDQEGEWFDSGVNENNPEVRAELDAEPKSEEINELNRYATLDNAQSRTLNHDEQQDAVKRAKTNR